MTGQDVLWNKVKWLYEYNFIWNTATIIYNIISKISFSNPKSHMLHMNWPDWLRHCFSSNIHSQTLSGKTHAHIKDPLHKPIFKMQSLHNIQVLIYRVYIMYAKLDMSPNDRIFSKNYLFLGCGKPSALKKIALL